MVKTTLKQFYNNLYIVFKKSYCVDDIHYKPQNNYDNEQFMLIKGFLNDNRLAFFFRRVLFYISGCHNI